jgi:Tfp pilus assembly protein PilF
MKRPMIVIAALVACAGAAGASPMAIPSHYSVQHHPVSTSSAEAQAAFDEGLTLLYAFNRIAARQAFARAAAADPDLAMAYWGIAESYGPNINTPADDADGRAGYDAVVRAKALSAGASDEENAYVSAEAARYSNAPHPNYASLARAYERAMGDLMHRYPDDLDAATLYAESEMDLHAWMWFTSSGQPVEGTNDIIATLESVLSRDPMHIGANHFYIHATEESTHPERAIPSAERLGTFTFESGAAHLVHMPAHTYMRTGFFDLTVSSNVHALEHDRVYLAGEADREASVYYSHNLYFLTSAYQMEGDYADAKQTAAMMVEQGAEVPAMFASCRFARWRDILALSAPKNSPDEPLRAAVWHYARGLAFAGTGDLANAQKERDVVAELDRTLVMAGIPGFNNGSKAILGIALDVLDAKIALARNKPSSAVALLTHAAHLQDNLLYVEPPDWYYPVRESLGAAFLRSGDLKGAEKAFRDDLVRNPRNGRSLFGLAESLKAQGDATDEAWVRRAFEKAWQNADTTLTIDQL